ncbi:MAG: histidine phosphatase family protein [Thermoanaerobaculia bacterium]
MIDELILVRHGETLHNVAGIAQGWNDSALSERGQRQVRQLALRIASLHPDAIISSPLQRALTTARAIAQATGLEIKQVDELREMGYGEWEGQSFPDVRRNEEQSYRRWIADPDHPSPSGESHNDVRRRMEHAFGSLFAESGRVVVVSHGTAIRIAATVLLKAPIEVSRHLAQDNASMSLFVRRGDAMVLKLWNDTSHCAAE